MAIHHREISLANLLKVGEQYGCLEVIAHFDRRNPKKRTFQIDFPKKEIKEIIVYDLPRTLKQVEFYRENGKSFAWIPGEFKPRRVDTPNLFKKFTQFWDADFHLLDSNFVHLKWSHARIKSLTKKAYSGPLLPYLNKLVREVKRLSPTGRVVEARTWTAWHTVVLGDQGICPDMRAVDPLKHFSRLLEFFKSHGILVQIDKVKQQVILQFVKR